MKIKMNTLLAGPAGVMEAGKVYDVDPAMATSLVAGGYAQRLETAARIPPAPAIVEPIETAVPQLAAEQAVKPRTRRKS